ncbi:MAG: 50S ribosomal protein L23 [Parcubacteria group bacterium GW2011_GWC1_41_7]|nr:MAG: 50S ribosomal protein L23 [Parcubacteria group bacterium GW2011_GWC1_41_7]
MGILDFLKKKEKAEKKQSKKVAPVEKKKEASETKDPKPSVKIVGKTNYNWTKDVIKEPVLTEKTHALVAQNIVVFTVDPRANRTEVRQAVERIFNVIVEDVRISRAKSRRRGRTRMPNFKPLRKKAFVKLAPGSKISLFE